MATRSKNYDPQKRYIDVYNDFSGGINTAYATTKLKENQFIELINLDIDKIGQAIKRYGLKKFSINGIALSNIIFQELKNQWKISEDKLTNLTVSKSYSFFDGIRQVINFATNIGLITVIFNQSFTDIEAMDDGTKLVLYYDEIIEYVKFINYNNKILCYCSRPETMKTTNGVVRKTTIKDPREVTEPISVDKEEPISFYSWNPTNRNKIKRTITSENGNKTYYWPIGWTRAYNYNINFSATRNIDSPINEIDIIKNKPLKTINENNFFNTHEIGNTNNKKIPIEYDFKNNFVDIEGSFEYIKDYSSDNKNVYVYKSLKYGTYNLIINDVKTNTDFLNFPIVFINGYFHFGGCTKDTFYIWKISLDDLRNKKSNLEVIKKEAVKKNLIIESNDVGAASGKVKDSKTLDLFFTFSSSSNKVDSGTTYDLIKSSNNMGYYGNVIKINNEYFLALPYIYEVYFNLGHGGTHKHFVSDNLFSYNKGYQTINFYKDYRTDESNIADSEDVLAWNFLSNQNNYLSISKKDTFIIKNNYIYIGIDKGLYFYLILDLKKNIFNLTQNKQINGIEPKDGTLYIDGVKTEGIYDLTPWGYCYLNENKKLSFKYYEGYAPYQNSTVSLLESCNNNFSKLVDNKIGAWYCGLHINVNQRPAKTIQELAQNQRYFENFVLFNNQITANYVTLMSAINNVGTNKIYSNDTYKYPFIYTQQTYDLTGLVSQKDIDNYKNNLSDLLEVDYSISIGNSNPSVKEKAIQILNGTKILEGAESNNQKLFRSFWFGFPAYINQVEFQFSPTYDGENWYTDFNFSPSDVAANNVAFSMSSLVCLTLKIVKAKLLTTKNPVMFEPIQLYIPSCTDMINLSYNLACFDDRQNSIDDLRSKIINHKDINPWIVQSIRQGGDNDISPNSYYLSNIIPVNYLKITPKNDAIFKLYAWYPNNKPSLLTYEINMSVDEYNNIFFNENFDWKKFMIKEGKKQFPENQKLINIPYGDREWVVGWATCAYSGSGSKVEDITSSVIKTAVYSFIPTNNDENTSNMTEGYFNDFLYTDKACIFASRVVLYGQSNRLFFSDLNNPCYFPLLNVIELPTQEVIISCVEFGYYLIVSTANSKFIIRGRSFDKTSSNPISLDLISSDTGSFATKADRVNGNYLFFLDKTGIKYLANAYGTAEKEYNFKPIDMLINKKLPKGLKANDAVATTHNNKYYINFPNTKQMFIYDNELNAWTQYKGELMAFNDMYSQDGILYCVSKNSMDLYWFDKDTYVDGYVGIDGLWDEKTYGAIWKSKVGSIRDGIYQVGMPIHTVLITRPFVGVDDAHVKAYYDLDVLIRSNIPMNHVDIQTSIDRDSAYPTLQMPGGRTPGKNMLYYAHYIGDSRGIRYKKYQRKYPQAILNQISILNYSRLGGTDLNLHKVKIGGRKGYTCMVAVINTTPGSYSIESIKMNYQFRSSK